MTLLTVMQDVCAAVGVAIPASVFTNLTNNRTMQEMVSVANEMAQRIAYDTRDWTKLRAINVFTGDGVKTAFNLPADYQRMLLTAQVWRPTSSLYPMVFVPDTNEWISRRGQNIYHSHGEWTMMGGQMLIQPVMPVGMTASFVYLVKNCVTRAAGGVSDTFAADGDSFLLGDRIHKLGIIWQWKAQKGAQYQEDLANYGDALTSLMGRDSPAPILIDKQTISDATKIAYPWSVPTA